MTGQISSLHTCGALFVVGIFKDITLAVLYTEDQVVVTHHGIHSGIPHPAILFIICGGSPSVTLPKFEVFGL